MSSDQPIAVAPLITSNLANAAFHLRSGCLELSINSLMLVKDSTIQFFLLLA